MRKYNGQIHCKVPLHCVLRTAYQLPAIDLRAADLKESTAVHYVVVDIGIDPPSSLALAVNHR